jgi:flavin-dependent dehydrogenase
VRIAIAGAGVAGSYISRLLRMRGYRSVDVFDIRHRIACGIHPCGYGVDGSFDQLVRGAGLDPSRYVLHVPPRLLAKVETVAARTSVVMIDKPAFIADLLDGVHVKHDRIDVERYDLVIDATGEARAYAPPLENDLKARVVQWRVRVEKASQTTFMSTRGVPGYAWIMPLSEDGSELHVGAGCGPGIRAGSKTLTSTAFRPLRIEQVICACGARIRLCGPDFTRIVHGNVWAVGEAAGLVGPASGAGNVYAMQSAIRLVDNLGNPRGYVEALRQDFSLLIPEARAVRKVLAGRLPGIRDLRHIRQGWARAGVDVAWRDMPRLALAMGRAFLEPGPT